MERISVIVPVYKVESYLDSCVQSIVDQTYTNLEILLVDDGSPDRCGAMCDDWAKIDDRIRVIHKQNGGLSDARNAGLEVATGDWIGFVDSDDRIAPDMYEKLYHAAVADDSDIAACGVQMVWEDQRPATLLTTGFNGVLDRDEAQRAILEESLLLHPVWYKLYRRQVIDRLPFAVGKWHEDTFWSYRVIGNAKRVSVLSEPLYFYLQRASSIMGTAYSLKRLDAMEAYAERQQYLETNFPQLTDRALGILWMTVLYHGQQAMRHLNADDRRKALMRLKATLKQHPITSKAKKALPLKHRVWILCEQISLPLACRLRNRLNIGI